MKKILMLSTGGTIASEPGEDGLVPKTTGKQMIELIPELDGLCEIDCETILNLDSTNVQPEEWAIMAEAAYKGLADYDGIVITHGTDTMAYSAAALTQMITGLKKPIVLTGSQLPIKEEGTDAKDNIYNAFVAATSAPAGVYIMFNGLLISGLCATKVRTVGFDAFISVNHPPVGRVVDGKLVIENAPEAQQGELAVDSRFDPKVMIFKLYPGFESELLLAAGRLGYHGVVIEAFGSGGVPYHRRDLIPAIEQLIKDGITVVVTTQCQFDGVDLSIYDVGVRALRAGVIPAGDMTTELSCVKLMTLLGRNCDHDEIARLMQVERKVVDPTIPL